MLLHLFVLFIAIPPLARGWGVTGAAYGDLIAMSASTAALFLTARRVTGQTKWSLPSTLIVPGISALLAAALAGIVAAGIPDGHMRFIGESGLLLAGYVVLVMAFGGKTTLYELIDLLRAAMPWSGRSRSGVGCPDKSTSAEMTLTGVEVRS
jgi:hypothetical protein